MGKEKSASRNTKHGRAEWCKSGKTPAEQGLPGRQKSLKRGKRQPEAEILAGAIYRRRKCASRQVD
ncbi:MAG: hypothetical protein IJ121_06890 [Eubacterium sp.]|nr:hypothetical protein [Eubacterium sp.]